MRAVFALAMLAAIGAAYYGHLGVVRLVGYTLIGCFFYFVGLAALVWIKERREAWHEDQQERRRRWYDSGLSFPRHGRNRRG